MEISTINRQEIEEGLWYIRFFENLDYLYEKKVQVQTFCCLSTINENSKI